MVKPRVNLLLLGRCQNFTKRCVNGALLWIWIYLIVFKSEKCFMEKLKNLLKRGFVSGACLFTLVACGNTGPDTNDPGSGSGSGVASSVAGFSSQNANQSSVSSGNLTASMPDKEIVEGTFPIVNGRLDSDGRPYTSLTIDIQLSKPMEQDTKVYLVRDKERTQCPTAFDETALPPDDDEPITANAGSNILSFVVEAFPDAWMENDCDAYYQLKLGSIADPIQIINVAGKVRLLDDDHQSSWGANFEYGKHYWIPLMGFRDYDARTFTIEQTSGRPINYVVEGKYLHIVLPATPYNTLAPDVGGVPVEDFYFNIKPSNGDPEFQIRVHVPLAMMAEYVADNVDGQEPAPEDTHNYERFIWENENLTIDSIEMHGFENNFYYKDLSKISWTLKTRKPDSVLKLYPLSFDGFKNVSSEDFSTFVKEGAIVFDEDNRTIRFNQKLITLISKYIYEDRLTEMTVEVKLCESSNPDARCKVRLPLLRLMPANQQLSVEITGLGQQMLAQPDGFNIVVKDVTDRKGDHSQPTRVIPLASLAAFLGNFPAGQYELSLRDYKGEYRAEQSFTLYPEDAEKKIALEVVRDPYVPDDLPQP